MKRWVGGVLLAVIVSIAGLAGAEVSTNLRIRKDINPSTKQVIAETYVDEAVNPVVASDKGYATIRYTYITKRDVSRIELLDAEGNLVNGREGYARIEKRYRAKELYVGKWNPNYQWAFSDRLLTEMRRDFKRMAPLYQMLRGIYDEIE